MKSLVTMVAVALFAFALPMVLATASLDLKPSLSVLEPSPEVPVLSARMVSDPVMLIRLAPEVREAPRIGRPSVARPIYEQPQVHSRHLLGKHLRPLGVG